MNKYLFLIIVLVSCHTDQKFDKEKWAEVADLMTFPKRKNMINDLVKNYNLNGQSYSQIINLLGHPQSKIDIQYEISYDIDVNYGTDIDPIYSKALILHFSKDFIVQNFEVKEYKK